MLRLFVLLSFVLFPALLAVGASPASAASCSVDNATLAFGPADTLSTQTTTASTTLHISCNGVSAGVAMATVCAALGAGTGGSSGSVRELSDGLGDVLSYDLYSDLASTTLWGDSSAGFGATQQISLPVTNGTADEDVSVYGQIAGRQTTTPTGSYSSSVPASFYYAEGETLDCASPGGAPSTSATLTVNADVEPNCLIDPTSLDFGATGAISSNLDAQTDIGLTCTPGIQYDVSLDNGQHAMGAQRYMQSSSGQKIAYDLYQDPGHAIAWGTGSAARHDNRSSAVETVYGRAPPQAAPVGSYSDTIVVTVTYAGSN